MSETIPSQLPPPRRRSSLAMIIAAVMAALIIIVGVLGLLVYHNNQVTQDHIHATATVVQTLANNHATATVVDLQNAAATVVAIPGLTATAAATSPYAPFTKVVVDDPLTTFTSSGWNNDSACQISPAGYQISITKDNYTEYCNDTTNQYGEIAYQVTMTIHIGDCGGLTFGYNGVNDVYKFEVCQDGTYNVYSYLKGVWTSLYPYFRTSSEIRQGLNVQNRVAVTLKGDTINIYVNGKNIDTATDLDLTALPIRRGYIGLFAEDRGKPTSVLYNDALVWSR